MRRLPPRWPLTRLRFQDDPRPLAHLQSLTHFEQAVLAVAPDFSLASVDHLRLLVDGAKFHGAAVAISAVI